MATCRSVLTRAAPWTPGQRICPGGQRSREARWIRWQRISGNCNMLDNTVIVSVSDNSDKHHTSVTEWPLAVAGNLSGRLNSRGRYLLYPSCGSPGHHHTTGHRHTNRERADDSVSCGRFSAGSFRSAGLCPWHPTGRSVGTVERTAAFLMRLRVLDCVQCG